jgi:site-specific recombinase XerC
MSLEMVQRFLGHSKIQTTEIYAQSTPAAVAGNYRRAVAEAAQRPGGAYELGAVMRAVT